MKVHLAVPGKKTACGIPAGGFRNDRRLVATSEELLTNRNACNHCCQVVSSRRSAIAARLVEVIGERMEFFGLKKAVKK